MQTSGPTSNAQWYLARDGEQFGPISDAEMAKLVELGHLKPTDLLWREGFPDWRPAMVVFPPRAKPMPGAMPAPGPVGPEPTRRDARQPAGRPRALAEPLGAPAPADRAGYAGYEAEGGRRPGVLARMAKLLLLVAVLAAAAGAAYVYRGQLTALAVSFTQPSGPVAIADHRSLELPPLAGFRAGNAEAVDAALQSTALWKVIKREFPEWYDARIAEAVQMAQESKDEAVISQLMGRKVAELRRQQAAAGLSATAERLKTVAAAYSDSLKRLLGHSPEACSGFILRGETEPLIAALLQQGTALTAHLQAHLTAVFEAIAEGRQLPRVHPRPTPEHQQLLQDELVRRSWTADDFKLLSNLGQASPDKVCQLVGDFFATVLALSDPEAQTRLLINSLRPVFFAG